MELERVRQSKGYRVKVQGSRPGGEQVTAISSLFMLHLNRHTRSWLRWQVGGALQEAAAHFWGVPNLGLRLTPRVLSAVPAVAIRGSSAACTPKTQDLF